MISDIAIGDLQLADKLKVVHFRLDEPYDKELLKSIESLKLNFTEETKVMWLSRIKNISIDNARNQYRLNYLKTKLNDKTLHRSHVWKIQNEIKQIEESMNETN